MSSLIYLIAMLAIAWLVLWTIRDPQQPNWDWWPIEWWPFDTMSEEAAAAEVEKQAALAASRQAIPWRERGKVAQRARRVARATRKNHTTTRPWH
jgi:hypothetical protein